MSGSADGLYEKYVVTDREIQRNDIISRQHTLVEDAETRMLLSIMVARVCELNHGDAMSNLFYLMTRR